MPTLASSMPEAVHAALQARFPVRRLDSARWEMACRWPKLTGFEARLHGDWLTLSALVPDVPSTPWPLLECHRDLAGPVRYCLPPGSRSPSLRADVLLDPEGDPADSILFACDALHSGVTGQAIDGQPEPSTLDLAALCSEAGWIGNSRPTGSVAVPLEDREGWQALLEHPLAGESSPHGATARLSVVKTKSLSEASREAIARLLLEAAGLVRLVRPVAVSQPERVEVLLEVRLGLACGPALLDAALSALQVAGRRCGREARALADEWVASEYLRIRGWSSSQFDPG